MFFRFGTNYTNDSLASDYSAVITHSLYGCSNFHKITKIISRNDVCVGFFLNQSFEDLLPLPAVQLGLAPAAFYL